MHSVAKLRGRETSRAHTRGGTEEKDTRRTLREERRKASSECSARNDAAMEDTSSGSARVEEEKEKEAEESTILAFPSEHLSTTDERTTTSSSMTTPTTSLTEKSFQQLSISSTPSATPLPPSSPPTGVTPTTRAFSPQRSGSSSNTSGAGPAHGLIRRSSSSSINHAQKPQPLPQSPTLNKRTSMSSLQGLRDTRSPRNSPRYSSSSVTQPSSPSMPGVGDSFGGRPAVTAASYARAHFEAELAMHDAQKHGEIQTDTVVILHDSCYGHRYSRPRTSKAALNTVVERPERLHAAAMGIATAYVRLGERHADGKHAPRPTIGHGHLSDVPFHIQKSSRSIPLSSPVVANVHGTKWMNELKSMCEAAEAKLALDGNELSRGGDASGDDPDRPKLHEGDLYLCDQSLDAFEGALGAVCDGVDVVFQGTDAAVGGPNKAFVCVRPPGHHCSSSYPSGFCWLNNVHVGISYAAQTYGLTHAAIIDFDLHHGDGSQAITWDHNARLARLPKNASGLKRASIGYFSLHDINSYPCESGDEDKVRNASLCLENAHGQTIWNVHLQAWKDEREFWSLYESRYALLLDKARDFLRAQTQRLSGLPNQSTPPRAAIFLSAGFDASEWEGAGMQRHKVNVPTEFYARFTADVVALASEADLAVEGRIISVLEGGYSDRALMSGVLSHLSGLTRASPATGDRPAEEVGLGYEMGKRIGVVERDDGGPNRAAGAPSSPPFDPAWWSVPQLEQLEILVNPGPPPPPPPAARRTRINTPPGYTSTTQSFMAKIVSTPKTHRAVSGSAASGGGPGSSTPTGPSRAPSPPPPAVDWATAAHELGKLLIPSHRQTRSCQPEELSAEASRGRKARYSTTLGAVAADAAFADVPADAIRRSTRERKGRTPSYVFDDGDETSSRVSLGTTRSDRRRTLAGSGSTRDSSTATVGSRAGPGRAPALGASSRRLSGVSIAAAAAPTRAELTRPTARHGANGATTAKTNERAPPREPAKAERATRAPYGPPPPPAPPSVPRAAVVSSTTQHPRRAEGKKAVTGTSSSATTPAGQDAGADLDAPSSSSTGEAPNGTDAPVVDEAMEELTLGLVRVELNKPSREEYEARRAS